MATPRSGAESEPVAMTIALAATSSRDPSSLMTRTLPGAATDPTPRTESILFFLKRKATPETLASTTASLWPIIAFKSSTGVPTPMPKPAKSCPAASNSSEVWRSAFDGMQPTLRQVPPNVGSFSTTATLRPSWAARMAQT